MGIFCNRKANACIFCPLIDLILNFSCVEVLFFQISAIWQHLRSVLQWYVRSNHPDVSVIHSSSDGPCSRYRQRGNFFSLFSELNNRSSRVHEISLRPAVARRHLTVGRGGCRGALLEKTGWSLGESAPRPNTWTDPLSSSPEDEHCAEAVSLTILKGGAGKHPSQHAICFPERWGFIRWA